MDRITFIGSATALIRLGRFNLLTDPSFLRKGQRAYLGGGRWTRRRIEPGLSPDDLPTLDAVVLTHLLGDHFDRVARRELDPTAPVVTTEYAARRLAKYGFVTKGLPVWGWFRLRRDAETVTIRALPAVHGRRGPPGMGALLVHHVAGVVRRRIYISGDTLTGEHLEEIHARHPSIDLAIVHLGGERQMSVDAEQGFDLLHRIEPQHVLPVHYGDYGIYKSPLADFLTLAKGWPILTPERGETIELPEPLHRLEEHTTARPLTIEPESNLRWRLNCRPNELWPALTQPHLLSRWLGEIRFIATEHGVFTIRCPDETTTRKGVIVTCDPNIYFQIDWLEPAHARLRVDLAPTPDGTLLTLTTDAPDAQLLWDNRLSRLESV